MFIFFIIHMFCIKNIIMYLKKYLVKAFICSTTGFPKNIICFEKHFLLNYIIFQNNLYIIFIYYQLYKKNRGTVYNIRWSCWFEVLRSHYCKVYQPDYDLNAVYFISIFLLYIDKNPLLVSFVTRFH